MNIKIGDKVRRLHSCLYDVAGFEPDTIGVVEHVSYTGHGPFGVDVRLPDGALRFWLWAFFEPVAVLEPAPRLRVDQLWAKLQAQGLSAQQVRRALDLMGAVPIIAELIEHPSPLWAMFTWYNKPEGHAYWEKLAGPSPHSH